MWAAPLLKPPRQSSHPAQRLTEFKAVYSGQGGETETETEREKENSIKADIVMLPTRPHSIR